MIVEAYLETILPDFKAVLEDDDQELEIRLQEDLDIECWLEPDILIEGILPGEYELEG